MFYSRASHSQPQPANAITYADGTWRTRDETHEKVTRKDLSNLKLAHTHLSFGTQYEGTCTQIPDEFLFKIHWIFTTNVYNSYYTRTNMCWLLRCWPTPMEYLSCGIYDAFTVYQTDDNEKSTGTTFSFKMFYFMICRRNGLFNKSFSSAIRKNCRNAKIKQMVEILSIKLSPEQSLCCM